MWWRGGSLPALPQTRASLLASCISDYFGGGCAGLCQGAEKQIQDKALLCQAPSDGLSPRADRFGRGQHRDVSHVTWPWPLTTAPASMNCLSFALIFSLVHLEDCTHPRLDIIQYIGVISERLCVCLCAGQEGRGGCGQTVALHCPPAVHSMPIALMPFAPCERVSHLLPAACLHLTFFVLQSCYTDQLLACRLCVSTPNSWRGHCLSRTHACTCRTSHVYRSMQTLASDLHVLALLSPTHLLHDPPPPSLFLCSTPFCLCFPVLEMCPYSL